MESNSGWGRAAPVLVLVGLLGTMAGHSSADGKGDAADEQVAGLCAAAQEARAHNPMGSLLLAREAFARAQNAATRTALYDALVGTYERALFRGHEAPLASVDLSIDESLVLTASEDGTARIWKTTGDHVRTVAVGRPLLRARFLADDAVLTVSVAQEAGRVDVQLAVGDELTALGTNLAFDAYAVSAARDRVLVSAGPGAWRLHDAKGAVVRAFEASSAAFDAPGRHVLTVDKAGRAVVLDAAGRGQVVLKTTSAPAVLVGSPAGRMTLAHANGVEGQLFDAKGKPIATLTHEGPIEQVCFSPDGQTVVIAAGDQYVHWSATGRKKASVPKHGKVTHMAFSRDGAGFAAATDEPRLTLWFSKPQEPFAFTRLQKIVRRIHAGNGGHWITLLYEDGSLGCFDVEMKPRYPLGSEGEAPLQTIWDPQERWCMSTDTYGRAGLVNFESRLPIWLEGHSGLIVDAVFAQAHAFVVTASSDGTARLWDLRQRGTPRLGGGEHEVWSGACAATGDRVVTMAWSKSFFHDMEGRPIGQVQHEDVPSCWAFCGDRIAVAPRDGQTARVYDYEGKELTTLAHGSVVSGVAFLHDGTAALTWSALDKSVRIYDAKGKATGRFESDGTLAAATFLEAKDRVATLGPGDRIRVWTHKGKVKADWKLPERAQSLVALQAGKLLVTLAADGSVVRCWDEKGAARGVFKGHTADITSFGLSKSGDLFLTASKDKSAKLWKMDGTLVRAFQSPSPIVSSDFFHDDDLIGAACEDGVMRIYDCVGGLHAELQGHDGELTGWHATPAGDRVVTFAKDFTARIWPVSDEDIRRVAAERSSRDFTEKERQKYAELLAR